MLILSEKDQRNLVNMKEVIECTEIALKEFSAGRSITPIRNALPFDNNSSTALFMPSVAEGLRTLGLKVVMVSPENKNIGKKTINGVVMLSNFDTGEPLALLEGSYLTKVRTGALSGVATKYFSRKDSNKLLVIGTGEQAEGLIEAILAVRDIEEIMLYNRSPQKALEFSDYVMKKFNKKAQIYQNSNEPISMADIIVTSTTSTLPVFSALLKPGVHLNAVGSFRPTMQELPSSAICSADKVIVESIEAAIEETGDLINPIIENVFKESDIYAELGQVVNGDKPGRESEKEITIFKSVGLSIVDIIVAKYLYEKAIDNNIGVNVKL